MPDILPGFSLCCGHLGPWLLGRLHLCQNTRHHSDWNVFLYSIYSCFWAYIFSLRSVEQLYLAMTIKFIPRSEEPRRSIKENSPGPSMRERALICLTHANSGGFLLITLLHQNAKQHIWNHLKVLFYWLLTNVPTNKTLKSVSGRWVTFGTLVEPPSTSLHG